MSRSTVSCGPAEGRQRRPPESTPGSAGHTPPNAAGKDWLARTSADPGACLIAWRTPHALAPVRLADDSPWHVISTDVRLGDGALQVLAAANAVPGPALLTDTHLHFWVPRLTADWDRLLAGLSDTPDGPWAWGKALTVHLTPSSGTTLLCPAPGADARKARWVHAPDGSGALTYAGGLAAALHDAFRVLFAAAPAIPAPRTEKHPRQSDPAARADHFAAFIGRPNRTEAP
ncbi:hypothetical protein ACFRKE_00600 [Kitasatospora indigofera]|uniref:hypothetical protein n=1 Tax=Kitasatospora indigofera TaxID=67307 RepID=UPI003629A6C1